VCVCVWVWGVGVCVCVCTRACERAFPSDLTAAQVVVQSVPEYHCLR
jgi:hypothetical protein